MKEEKNETKWDRLLANSGLIRKENTLLDYGCGKGRVDFFMSYQTRCQSIGVEYNEHFR